MTPSIQVVVITHADGIAAHNRHRKYWEAFNAPILTLSPRGMTLENDHLAMGSACRNGPDSIKRLQALFNTLSERTWERVVIYEYDSFSLEPKLSTGPGLHGILFPNQESPKFLAPVYANPPWTLDRGSFGAMHAKALAYPNLYEDGEADRWLSALAWLAGVPLMSYEPPGFSRGTITTGDLPALMGAVKGAGVIHFHGIKQEWVLRAIEQWYDEANPGKIHQ